MSALRQEPGYDELQHRLAGMQIPPSVQRMPATHPSQVFFHFDILRSLQMHRKMAVGIFLFFLLLSGGYMAKRWNSYKASAIVYVQPSPPRLMANGPAQQWPYDANTYESYIQQQIHDVTRPDVLIAAVKRIPGFQGQGESDQAAADHLNGNLKVTRVGNGYQISIEAAATDPEGAALAANSVAGAYIQSATRELRAGDPQRIQLLGDERDRITKELASDRTEQEDLNKKLGVASVGAATPDPYDDQIAAVRAELVKARTAHDEAAATLTSQTGSGQNSAALDAEADELVAADPGLGSMKMALNKRRSELISQMANLTPNHPEYKQDAEELSKINTSLDTMSKELRAKAGAEITQRLKNALERTSSVEATLNAQLAQMTSTAGSATPRLQRESDLSADINRLQNRFAVVDEQYRNLTMENNAPGAVYLSAAALPPLHAARKTVMRNGLIVLIAGLVFALGAALIAHNLDPKIYIAADVERVLGFSPMALLPDFYEVGTGVAEEYMLRLASGVEHAHQQGVLNSCIFTGVAPGAGVTTVSTRVTNMLQAMGRATVLVDAVGTPPPARPLEALTPGSEIIHSPRGSRSTALLQQMTQEAGEDTIVVTDTAPLLVSGETEYLARFVDSAIIVVESAVTTKAQLREVARTLQRLEVSAVGFVLNRISVENANPSFKQSVRAVEKHIRNQARAFDRAAARNEMPALSESEPASQRSRDTESARRSPDSDRLWNAGSEPMTEPASRESRPQVSQPIASPKRASFIDPDPEPAHEIPVSEIPAEPPAFDTKPEASWPEPVQARVPASGYDQMSGEPSPQFHQPWNEPSAAAAPAQAAPFDPDATWPFASAAANEVQSVRTDTRTPPAAPRPARGREGVHVTPADPMPSPMSMSEEELVAAQWEVYRREANLHADLPFVPATEQRGDPSPESARETRAPQKYWSPDEDAVAAMKSGSWPQLEPDHVATADATASRFSGYAEPQNTAAHEPARALPVSAGEDPAQESDGLPFSAASRLGGLRNLLVSLGVQNLHKETEQRKADAITEIRVAERPVYAVPDSPSGDETLVGPLAAVTARPELIPPRLPDLPEREIAVREKEPPRPVKSPQVNRWDSPDDVETLPSRRGQYRKRH
ncbi:MAG TPA: hypothetical protein VKB38_13570 [Terracidiphilus sp.]|nr:hypothetical protein [Terracidiphilus sp.]